MESAYRTLWIFLKTNNFEINELYDIILILFPIHTAWFRYLRNMKEVQNENLIKV